ncbi:MAG: LysR family transcriptional regulator [Pseudomonadota bacterium]
MEFQQLKSFVAVAQTGSITRASDILHLSQPAVSAHIKAMEETLGLQLFERTARGMVLTTEGNALKARADAALSAHGDVLREATRLRGALAGKFRLAAAANAQCSALGALMVTLAERYPDVEIELTHATSPEVLEGIRSGRLDAGFYVESEDADEDLTSIEVARFGTYLAAPAGMVDRSETLDWQVLQTLPWICPGLDSCCGRSVEALFQRHNFRPTKIISIDRESVTRTLLAGGVGIGLLHADTAREAQLAGEIDILCEVKEIVRVLFVHLAERGHDPLLDTVSKIVRYG